MSASASTTPTAYFARLPANRRADVKALHAAIRQAAPRLKPFMAYSGTIIGYGPYHYQYASGHEGDASIVGLSNRAQGISLYISGHRNGKTLAESAKSTLGKVSVGKACIRFKKLADLNLAAAMDLVREASVLLDNGRTDFSL